jgi:hypothetical protein
MGFRTARAAAPEPSILLIVSLAADAIKSTSDIGDASAVLIRPNSSPLTATSVKKIVATLPDIPVGFYLEDADDSEIAAMIEAGGDFLVFPASSRISAAPADKKPGRILQVESAMDDSLLRAVNSLPVDAVLVADTFEGGSLVWHELMIFQHLANTLAKPLMINIPANITEAELKALWEAGADGVVVEADKMKATGMKELQKTIGKLPPRSARKRGKIEALLPRTGGESLTPAPPDEEEEEDE